MSDVSVKARRCEAAGGNIGKVKESNGICAASGNWPSPAQSGLDDSFGLPVGGCEVGALMLKVSITSEAC